MSVRLRIRLASAMWVPVLGLNAIALGLALGLPYLDEGIGRDNLPIPIPAAQAIFGALAAGMITFTGIVFSAVFVAAQIQTSSYSPRVAARLRRDPVVIASLALPTATATYALFALAAIGRHVDEAGHRLVPAVTVVFGLVLAVVTLGAFVALVQHAFDNTQIGGILRGLLRRGLAVIADVYTGDDGRPGELPGASRGERAIEVNHDGDTGVIAAVDREAVLRLAEQTGGMVEVVPMVGRFVARGAPILRIHDGAEPEPKLVGRALVLGRQRTIDQDPAFTLRMLVDIAIRALSPAVNDPTTAVQALDRIEALLLELHRLNPGPVPIRDAARTLRGWVPAPTWREYLSLGLLEIRRYGGGSPQVARRLHALYDRLELVTRGDDLDAVTLERRLLDARLEEAFADPEERALVRRPDPMGLGGAL
jgi:uncharacterized membrane protein